MEQDQKHERLAAMKQQISELSAEEAAALLPEFERLERGFREIVDECDSYTEQWRKERGKERLPFMMKSQENALGCLRDPDPNIRVLALHLFMEFWKIPDRIAEECERMATADPALDVRSYAISVLGRCYEGKSIARVGELCARVVSNPDLSLPERRSAYLALILIMDDKKGFGIGHALMEFPKSIDWDFVNRNLSVALT